MHIGLTMFPTDTGLQPIELAKEAEARGFESLWFPEHSHIPSSRATPWGGREGAPPLPEEYWHTHHQMVAFGACAAVTTELKLGTGITLVAQRDPIWMAKEVATVDALSGGRFLFGIGYGWNKEELRHHGVKYLERRAVLRERILAMKELWTKEEASFSGEHVSIEPSWSYPKPTQKPHPPIIMGGTAGPKTMADIIEFCDGWIPIGGRRGLPDQITELRQMAQDKGRDPDSIEISVFGARPDQESIDRFREMGVVRVALSLPSTTPDAAMEKLEEYTALKDQLS
jgi:probable F420-dependent oxidoreductase